MSTGRIVYQIDQFILIFCEYSTCGGKYNSRWAACTYTCLGTAQYLGKKIDYCNQGVHMADTKGRFLPLHDLND